LSYHPAIAAQMECHCAGRPSSWKTFIKSHAAVIAAADFFTTEV
jgi:hypothetical protein